MKRTISVILALIMAFTLPCAAFASGSQSFDWSSYWQSEEKRAAVYVSPGHTENSRYFTWFGSKNGGGTVTVKGADTEKTFTAPAQKTPEGDYIYKVYATGLEDGVYTYTCKSEGFRSKQAALTVSSSTDFSVVYVTDVHMTASNGEEKLSAHAEQFDRTLQAAQEKYGASLLLSGGDQATMGLRDEYTAFVSSPALKNMTTALSVGNHDRKGAGYKTFATFPYESYAGLKSYVGRDYWFVKGDVLFLMIDSNCPDASAHRSFMRSAVLQNMDVKWRVAVMHHDLFGGRLAHRESENRLLRMLYVPLMDEFDVDLVLSGHSHYYTRSNIIKGGLTTGKTSSLSSVKDPNGTLYVTSGSYTTNKRAAESEEIPPLGDRVGYDYLTSEGIYNVLTFSEDSIRLRSFTVSGEEPFNEFSIEKSKGASKVLLPSMPLWNGFVRFVGSVVAFFNNAAMKRELENERGLDVDPLQALFGCESRDSFFIRG